MRILVVLTAAVLAATPAYATESPVCQKLHQDFKEAEISYGLQYELLSNLLTIERKHGGTYRRSQELKDDLFRLEQTYTAKGQSLTQLMSSYKCKLPDHVMSPLTYREGSAVSVRNISNDRTR